MSHIITILDWFCVASGYTLIALLLILVFRYNMFHQLKFFAFYVLFTVVRQIGLEWYGVPPAIGDPSYYRYLYCYWTAAFVLSFLRLFITLEICEKVLTGYPALKLLAWRILSGLATVLFSWTIYFAIRNIHHIRRLILTFQQTTDISFAILLLTLMGIGVYYRMRIPSLYRMILIGSCIYSAVQVVDSELGRHIVSLPNSVFDFVQRLAYSLMLGIWAWAVWRWGRDSNPPVELISQSTYDDLSPQIHDRLRELNDKLTDLTGKRRQ